MLDVEKALAVNKQDLVTFLQADSMRVRSGCHHRNKYATSVFRAASQVKSQLKVNEAINKANSFNKSLVNI